MTKILNKGNYWNFDEAKAMETFLKDKKMYNEYLIWRDYNFKL